MTAVALALPLAVALLLARVGARLARRDALPAPRRSGLLLGLLATASVGVLLTEALSVVRSVTPGALAGGWALALVAALAAGRRVPAAPPATADDAPQDAGSAVLWAFVATVLALTLVVALAAPPNTWDSLTYHMSRVQHWAGQQSLAHYPSHIRRQIVYPPGAELAALQLQLLSGGDRLANLVQWSSFVAVVVAVSTLAAYCGAGRRGQGLAALIAATTPMAILQASSTQNDLVTALALTALAGWIVAWRRRPAAWLAAAIGLTLGLALLVKVTAYVLALPLLAWLAADLRRRGRGGLTAAALIVGLALLLNAGHYARQATLGGRALAATDDGGAARPDFGVRKYLNEAMSPGLLASNLARNLALHVTLPGAARRARFDTALADAHAALGLDAVDPRTTYPTGRAFRVAGLQRHEDLAPNPLHLALLLATAAIAAASRSRPPLARTLFALSAASFLLFALVFKWQPWHSRLHLPLFMLAAPAAAAVLASIPRLRRATLPLAAALTLASLPFLLANATRPLLGRDAVLQTPRLEQYFANRPELRQPYVAAAALLRQRDCRDIGLVIGGDDAEYPLWVLLADAAGEPPRLRHVGVGNLTRFAAAPLPAAAPCAVIVVGDPARAAHLDLDRRYRTALESAPLRVMVEDDRPAR